MYRAFGKPSKNKAHLSKLLWNPQCFSIVGVSSNKLLANILRTVPVDKLKMIQKELSHTQILCKVDYDVTGKQEDGFCYVPEQPLEKLIDEVIGYNCLICDKGPDEYKRCEFYKSPWNIDITPEYRGCPFAQL